jgi:hypothetical protein
MGHSPGDGTEWKWKGTRAMHRYKAIKNKGIKEVLLAHSLQIKFNIQLDDKHLSLPLRRKVKDKSWKNGGN